MKCHQGSILVFSCQVGTPGEVAISVARDRFSPDTKSVSNLTIGFLFSKTCEEEALVVH